jgi:hypothetical protein
MEMMSEPIFNTQVYLKQVAKKIRAKQAEMLRGKPEALIALEHQGDREVLARAAWTAAIVGAISAFIAAPFLVGFIERWLPAMMVSLLWLLVKVAMLLVLLMFGAAVWLTLKEPHTEEQ